MTKAQIKAAIQGVFSKVFDKKMNDDSLKKLMDLNEQYGDGCRWCSFQQNLIGVIQGGNKQAIGEALNVYEEHYKIDGAENAMFEISKVTNGLNF